MKKFLDPRLKLYVDIIMVQIDINKSHVNIIMLLVDIIYLARRGQTYATIPARPDSMYTKHNESRQAVVSFFTNKYVMALYKKECFISIIHLILWCYIKIKLHTEKKEFKHKYLTSLRDPTR